jgi:hypothetical protein
MGRYYRELSAEHIEFIRGQRMFFVATAPSGQTGRINLSPKGYQSLHIIDPRTVAYVDYPGSGNETANHLRENGRLTFMWCSFEGKPLILRTYGPGRVIAKPSSEFAELMARHFPQIPIRTTRQLIVQAVEAVQTSCGSGVPLYQYTGERENLRKWADQEVAKGTLEDYIRNHASRSEEKFPLSDGAEG